MLFAIGFIFLFTVGGFSGLVLAMAAGRCPDAGYLLRRGALSITPWSLGRCSQHFAGAYYWLPKVDGATCITKPLGQVHFWLILCFL
jgi:cytochrome c oxidase subunit 1